MVNNMVEEKIQPFISVIIPTYHDWKRLQLCLDALKKQTYPKERFEILVVNNDPEDKVPDSLNLPSNCVILEEEKAGSYAARNKAISLAKGTIFAFTDADCQPKEDWLEVAVKFFDQNPEINRIAGKVLLYSKNEKETWAEKYSIDFELQQDAIVKLTNAGMTANMITKSHVLDKVGHFNDELLSLGDMEWGGRAESKGFKIKYLEDCIVRHPARYSLKELTTKTKRMAGGHVSINSNKEIFLMVVMCFKPPIKTILNAKKNNYSYKSISILYYLKIIRSIEIIKILRGKDLIRD